MMVRGAGGGDDPDRRTTPCPYCGEWFDEAASLRSHLSDHGAPSTERRPGSRPLGRASARVRRTWNGLRFLPLWFVLPANVVLVAVVWMSFSNRWHPAFAVAVRMALLPSILLLAARVAGQKPML